MIRRVILEWDDEREDYLPWHVYRQDADGYGYGELRVPTLHEAAAAVEIMAGPAPPSLERVPSATPSRG